MGSLGWARRGALKHLIAWLLPVFLLIAPVTQPLWAQDSALDAWLNESAKIIHENEQKLAHESAGHNTIDALTERLKLINPIKLRAQECINTSQTALDKLTQDLSTLDEAAAKADPEVAKKRASLQRERNVVDTQLASCKLVLLQSQDLISSLNQRQQDILALRLSAKTPNIISVLRTDPPTPSAWLHTAQRFFKTQNEQHALSVQRITWMLSLGLLGLVLGIVLGRRLCARLRKVIPVELPMPGFIASLYTALARGLPVLLGIIAIAVYLSIALPLVPLPFISQLVFSLGAYFLALLLITLTFSPARPAQPYLSISPGLSRRFGRDLKILASLGLIGYLLFGSSFNSSLSESANYQLRAAFAILLIGNLISILWRVRRFSWATLSRGFRMTLILILIGCLVAELAGYRNLSVYALGGLLGSVFGLDISLLLNRLFTYLCDGLDESRHKWHVRLRRRLGMAVDGRVPGLIWVRMLGVALIWGAFVLWVLKVWDISEQGQTLLSSYLRQGFELGSLHVAPALLALALLIFAVILNLTRFIKIRVLPHWLNHTQLDRGAREAITAIFGYVGVTLSAVVALSIIGVQMQNLALIAGALSLGIGFGLQNIVNNFISGLILLFERPIRRGDWVVTANTEGYVRSINIRSTQIETFDKADVIVPNSELISSQVTNWMLRDPWGRISVAIGVSYDSDVDQVQQTLLEIANHHPQVMRAHPSVSEPAVLFMRFGDSALEFELRCFIHDVNNRLKVISDLNYAIFKEFKQQGIQIPFPQRDLTIKNWPAPTPPGPPEPNEKKPED